MKQLIKRLIYKVLHAGSAQAINSLVGFGLQVFLLEKLTKVEFGSWGMLYAFISLVAGLVGAYIGTQLVVSFYEVEKIDRIKILKSASLASALISFLLAIIFIIPLILFYGKSQNETLELVFPVVFCVALYGFKDCLIRGGYCNGNEKQISYGAVANLVLFICLMAYFWKSNVNIGLQDALLIYMVMLILPSAILVVCYGFNGWLAVNPFCMVKKSWENGKWSLLSSFAYSIRFQSHNYILPIMSGVSALAEVNAARLFISPVMLGVPAIKQVFLPFFLERNGGSFVKNLKACLYLMLILVAVGLLYTFLVFKTLPFFETRFAAGGYENIEMLVFAWCFLLIVILPREILSMLFQSYKKFKLLMLAGILVVILLIPIMIILTKFYSGFGSIASIIISEIVFLLLLVVMIKKIRYGFANV